MTAMPSGRLVKAPKGWKDLLERHPDQFTAEPPVAVRPEGDMIRRPANIHEQVLSGWRFKTDQTLYGTSDHWALPKRSLGIASGDCEDFALECRRRLVEDGWPSASARLALCMIHKSDAQRNHGVRGHMVLTIDLELPQGPDTLVLDVLRSRVMGWEEYRWDFSNDPFTVNGRWISREVPGRKRWERISRAQ